MSVSQEQTRTKELCTTAQCCFVPLPVRAFLVPLTAETLLSSTVRLRVQKTASSGSLVYRPPGEGLISFLSQSQFPSLGRVLVGLRPGGYPCKEVYLGTCCYHCSYVGVGVGAVSRKGRYFLVHLSPSWASQPRGVWLEDFTHPRPLLFGSFPA